jgi:hypothetical protein
MDRISTTLPIALGGIQRSLKGLQDAAQEIAAAPVQRTEPTELVDSLVHALEQQRALEASAKVIERTDDALSTLIDTFA